LYQHMLEEAVAAARSAGGDGTAPEEWTPQITIGMPVLIPETYVADLGVRLGLYRRIAQLSSRRERDAFAAELIDRFGPLPPEVENLLQIIGIKRDCREAGVERVEAGPKGAVITLRGNRFANPQGLVELIQKNAGTLPERRDKASASASMSPGGWPRAPSRIAAPRNSRIIRCASSIPNGAMRKVTSRNTSTKMPPRPSMTTGPNTGSFCTPRIISVPPLTIGEISTPSILARGARALILSIMRS